jgi:hypothetical protein
MDLTVKRNDQVISLSVTQEKICGYPVVLGNSDAVNAYADGKKSLSLRG